MGQIERIDEKAQLQIQRERENSGYPSEYISSQVEEQTTPVREGLKMLHESSKQQYFK